MFCCHAALAITLVLILGRLTDPANAQLGPVSTEVRWRAAHAAAYLDPYVIVYGGVEDPNASGAMPGSTNIWAWNSQNGSWFNPHPQIQAQSGAQLLPQAFFHATSLPSSGEMLALASNTSQGGSAGMLQKLDTTSWTWSFPTSASEPPARATGYTMVLINNTVYTHGGVSADTNGYPASNALLNSLSLLDASSFQWSSGSNGAAVTDHSTCYLASCNCLVTFGGTSTGNPSDATQNVYLYDLSKKTWNLQVTVGSVNNAMPGARRLHTATCLHDKMIVFGGGTTQAFDSDVWVLNASKYPTLTWERIDMNNKTAGPNSRMGHSAVLDPKTKRVYIFGGWGVSATNDTNMYVLDSDTWSWTRVSPTGFSEGGIPSVVSNSGSQGNLAGKIAGGVVGGVAGLAAIVVAFFFWRRRRNNRDKDQDTDVDVNVGPYVWDDKNGEPYSHNSWRKRASSKALTHTSYSRNSQMGMSEMGDTDKAHTVVLDHLSEPNSFRSSKVWMPNQKGQIPIEMTQKPNEFSVPAVRAAHHNIPVEHYATQSQGPPSPTDIARFNSMEVLQSMDGSRAIPAAYASAPRVEAHDDGEEAWASEAISYRDGKPIQYIPSSNQQYSIATTATGSALMSSPIPLTHHPYPSSNSSVPVARTVPQTNTIPKHAHELGDTPNFYDTVSPLDRLATLGQTHNQAHDAEQTSANLQNDPDEFAKGAPVHTSASSGTDTTSVSDDTMARFAAILPRHYRIDHGQTPIVGPTNSVLFIHRHGSTKEHAGAAVMKMFGRREAWERECDTLTKLKSPHVVTLLEIATFGDRQHTAEDVANSNDKSSLKSEEDDEKFKFGTVMERLDETLASVIRRARADQGTLSAWTTAMTQSTTRAIIQCLEWCHSKDIAFCDLKPSNIMRATGGDWKLIDFEASRRIAEECVGVITPRYCPPEVARATTHGLEGANGVVATAAVDLWALGCVVYELETKQALFPSNIKDETILHFVSHPSQSTPILNNGLRWNERKELEIPHLDQQIPSESTRQFIKMLLSRHPSKRSGTDKSLLDHPFFRQ